ncbi:MAG: S9 family peptidase [Myxococcota bacterium]
MNPPLAERRPHRHTEHGVDRDDPWYWLREKSEPAVLAHLEAENAFTAHRLAGLDPLRKQLYAEMVGRILETDATVPAPDGPWAYYSRVEAGKPHRIYCRRPRDGGPEQILIDVNALAEGKPYLSLGGLATSPDHRLCAYATDEDGSERHTVRIRDLSTGEDLPDRIVGVGTSLVWANDGTLLWCALDDTLRSFRVHRHRVGSATDPMTDPVLVEEPDPRYRLFPGRTRSGRFLTFTIGNGDTTEVSIVAADDPAGPRTVVFPRATGAKYQVSHVGRGDRQRLLVTTNVGADGVPGSAVNHRVLEVPIRADGLGAPIELVAHRDDVEVVGIDGFATFAAVLERDRGQLGFRLLDDAGGEHVVPIPERPCVIDDDANLEFDTRTFRFDYTSMTSPYTVFAYDLDARSVTRLKEQEVPGYDRTKYRTERLAAIAADGTEIPISIVYRADLPLSAGPHPLVLYGYGSYGITIDPVFSPTRVSLLDRGVVFAIGHVRGGGFLGRSWYEAGKFHHKQRSFTDFVACARHLVAIGATAPEKLAIWGGSAGGLLVGAAINLAPDLFRAALAEVPFVDVLTTMLDASLPLTAGEWAEWGDPRQRAFFDTIRAYSPLDNVAARRYPNLLATAGLNDPRVQYWEPAKWVQKLRATATDGEFLLWVQLTGHQGKSGRYGALEDRAFVSAWLLDQLGVAGVDPAPGIPAAGAVTGA